jgi:2-oxoisovalerate dehydrogenase E2 component (dihydrolipoyl transacylase)
VEEFDKICEVQSDKASVEITTRYTGVIKKLHYESGEMAIVGKPLVDIDVQEDVEIDSPEPGPIREVENIQTPSEESTSGKTTSKINQELQEVDQGPQTTGKGTHAALATPAVRHLTKELGVDIADILGTGRDGRVLKDDIYKFAEARKSSTSIPPDFPGSVPAHQPPPPDHCSQREITVELTNTQSQMFKMMTRSLAIPHFLYADEINFTSLSSLRHRLNFSLLKFSADNSSPPRQKLSYLPFIVKAVSFALHQYPILNARVDLTTNTSKPSLVMREQHNIGIAMDTPSGLLVPVIKSVQALSIHAIAAELWRLQSLASSGKLSTADLSGGTITVSNIGSIGGTYVSPVIVDSQVAILGIGKVRTVPIFEGDGEDGKVVPRKQACFSWSADHRIVNGATMARAAEVVREMVEKPDEMLVMLR